MDTGKQNILLDKSFAFALSIILLFKYLKDQQKEFVISKQILRCGTSIGAMVREAQNAESKPDFIHKLAIAQKECDETIYWLELLERSRIIPIEKYERPHQDAIELLKLLKSIILTTKNNLKRQ